MNLIVTMKGCVPCAKCKQFINARGIDYEEIDVKSREGEFLRKMFEFNTVPFLFINGETYTDLDDYMKNA